MDTIERFADLVVRAGVNVQPGQGVILRADTAHLAIARAVTRRAYEVGAAWVEPLWTDGPMRRAAVDHVPAEVLSQSRDWALARTRWWADQNACSISLVGDADPHLFDGADPARVAAFPLDELVAWRRFLLGGNRRWTAVGAPNPGWATEIYGEPDVDRLWGDVSVAMRLDAPDPAAAWHERAATLAQRAAALDDLELTEIRYVGDGTDLTCGLPAGVRWTGGGMIAADGLPYLPNIPTEEVFTSPDRRRVDGRFRVTKPVVIAGQLVTGLRVTVRDGRIAETTADSGADIVERHLDTDAGSRWFGEVSLVDKDSRIARAGIVFHNALFDENAGCHVAWGQSFPFAVAGGPAMSEPERAALGLNSAGVHTDVVIGGEGITVTGTGAKGEVTIIRDDDWVL
jgi:aminopeptidase